MGDRIFAPRTGEPPFESFSIVEDSNARKVIVLSPRGDGKLTLGCLFLLFFPAMFMTVPLVMSLIYGMDAGGWWLIVPLWSAAVALPLGLIRYGKRRPLSETSLVLEPHRVTLREAKFDRGSGESISVDDASIPIGPGSGITGGEDMPHEDGEYISLVIWGPTESLAIDGLTEGDEVVWLKTEIGDWLRRQVFEKPVIKPHDQPSQRANVVPARVRKSTKHRRPVTAGFLSLPQDSQIEVLSDVAELFALRIRPDGTRIFWLRWQAFLVVPFVAVLSLFILYAENRDLYVALGSIWLGGTALALTLICMSLETLRLEVSADRCVIRRTILGWTRRTEYDLGTSPAVFLKSIKWQGHHPTPTVCIRGVDGTAEFGTMLSDQEKRWLVMRLRELLKLDQRTSIFAEPEGRTDS